MRTFVFLEGIIVVAVLAYVWAKHAGTWSVCIVRDQACRDAAISGGEYSGKVAAISIVCLASVIWLFFVRKRK
jgi:hypothetical protein